MIFHLIPSMHYKLLILLDILLYCCGSLRTGYSKLQYGFRLDRRMIDSFTDYSVLDCVGECLRRKRCKSISYYQGAYYCEINYESRNTSPSMYVQDTGWIYSDKDDWEKNTDEECLNANCSENEKCNQLSLRTFKCILSDCGEPRSRNESFGIIERLDGIGINRRIHLRCAKSFNQTGSQLFSCQTNGKWNGDLPCETECPEGWFAFDNHCYIYGETKVSWADAKKNCASKNAYLVQVNGEKENSFLARIIVQIVGSSLCTGKYPCPVWIGANDIDTEGVFTWSRSNHTITYTNWYPKEPNNYKQQNCVRLYSIGQWDDEHCDLEYSYICEKE